MKNAVRCWGQYVYDEEGVRSVQFEGSSFEIKTALKQRSLEQSYEYDPSKSGTLTVLPACLMSVIHIPGSFRSQSFLLQIFKLFNVGHTQAYNESHLHPLHWAGSSVDGRRGGTARYWSWFLGRCSSELYILGQNSLPSFVPFSTRLSQRCVRSSISQSHFSRSVNLTSHPGDQVVMVHSGSQANGLAIQLARAQTGATDVIVFEHSFHGRYATI